MEISTTQRIKDLVEQLNLYRDAYYNRNQSLIADSEYDALYDELEALEHSTGIIMSNSPTQSVGYEVQSKLKKVEHNHPMLSLNKTKEVSEVAEFIKVNSCDISLKMDGLSLCLMYDENGDLISAETRGNGTVGEQVLNNAKFIKNIPLKINNNGTPFVIDGEVIVTIDNFNKFNETCLLTGEEEFSHPRNYAAGAIRQLDTKVTAERNISFIAWRVIQGIDSNSWHDRMIKAKELGFDVVPWEYLSDKEVKQYPHLLIDCIENLKQRAEDKSYPIDGLVICYDDIEFGDSLGITSHHPRYGIAFKFENEVVETKLLNIEWSVGKSGIVSPVAIFEPVDLNGAVTNRATLHNLNYIWDLGIDIGSKIGVIRSNEVVPRVEKNFSEYKHYEDYPKICPSCGHYLEEKEGSTGITLMCNNPNCPAKNLAKFVQFVSKQGMNIEGLSEATLEKFIDIGYIQTFEDIYKLDRYKDDIIKMEGFGKKSWDKLWISIQKSRNCKLENYLVALSIPLIGKSAARTISKHCKGSYEDLILNCSEEFDFTQLEDFGEKMNESIYNWVNDDYRAVNLEGSSLINYLTFEKIDDTDLIVDEDNFCNGKTFCVTGAFVKYKRSELEKIITDRGGKLTGSVSKKTNYLLTNDADSGSSKAVKAKELNIPILSEEEFIKKVGI